MLAQQQRQIPEQLSRRWRGGHSGERTAKVGLAHREVVQLVVVQSRHEPGDRQLVRTCDEDDGLGDFGGIGESEADGGVNGLRGLQSWGEIFTDRDVEALHLRHAGNVAPAAGARQFLAGYVPE